MTEFLAKPLIDGDNFLQLLWFFVIALVFAIFLFLDGIDFGVGMATRVLARNGDERALYMRAIGPHWDGNEVWLITGGGAMFAAFPLWYASLFSGYYLMLFIVLVGLILRGVSFEFASHAITDRERNVWQWANFVGSVIPPFFLGMMLTSLIQGVPMNAKGDIFGGFFDYVNLLSVVGGVAVVFFSFQHGVHFLSLKFNETESRRLLNTTEKTYWIAYPALVVFVLLAFFFTDFYQRRTWSTLLITIVILLSTICGHVADMKKRGGLAFTASGITLAGIIAFIFNGLFPNVIPAKNPSMSLTVAAASASQYTLQIMTIVLCCLLPIVLIYFIWSYFIQRKRLITDSQPASIKAVVAG